MKLKFEWIALLVLMTTACSTANTKSNSFATNLMDGKSWKLAMSDGCEVDGSDTKATAIRCPSLGTITLADPTASDIGMTIRTLSPADNETVGEKATQLTSAAGTYNVNANEAASLNQTVRELISTNRISNREASLKGADACPEGEVVHFYDECPSVDGLGDACGPSVTTCGKPKAKGEQCGFNSSCSSGVCVSPRNVCQ